MFKNDASALLDYGYRTKSTINLSADSYYMISADVYTDTPNGIASMYLTDSNNQEVYALRNKSSKEQWTTYMFFVKTTESKSIYLELHINGKGVVLYDNLSASKLSADEYNLRKSGANSNTYIATEETVPESVEYTSTMLSEINKSGSTSLKILYPNESTEVNDTFGNTSALKIDAISGSASYDVNWDKFTFKPNRIYKINVFAKVTNTASNGKVTLTYSPTEKTDVSTSTEKSLSITSATSSSLTNNYKVYSFYVKSHPSKTKTYKLNINVENAVAYFSRIQISNVTYATFSNVSTGTTAQTIDLASSESYDRILTNGWFNDVHAKDSTKPYPAEPSSWTVTTGKADHTQLYGVINTSELATLQADYGNVLSHFNTTLTSENNNVLMLYNSAYTENDTLSYVSATKTFKAKEIHKIAVNVLAQNAPTDLSLVSTIDGKEITLCSYAVQDSSNWQTIAFYVNGGERDLEVALKISLTSQNYAYSFVDDAWFDYYTQPSSVDPKNDTIHPQYDDVVTTDLTNLVVAETPENYALPLYFAGKGDTKGNTRTAGIITNTASHSALVNDAYKTNFEEIGNLNSLAINLLEKDNCSFTSKLPYTLSQDKHYAISLKVFTQGIETDENGLGLTLKLTEFEDEFKNVSTEKDGTNGWKTYTFCVTPNKDVNSYLTIALGTEELKASGKVFVADIKVDDSLEDFNSVPSENTLFLTKTTETEEESEHDHDHEETKENTGMSTQTLIYMIPSIIFAVAIVITVAAVLLKKVNFKKPAKKTKNEYDRAKTVSKQFYMRKATILREERLRELEKQAEDLKTQREQFEKDYKQNLSRLRELKIKRGNPAEIKQLEKEMKHAQHTASGFGLTLSKIENDIAYTKTDAYINSTIRKLQSAPIKVEEKDT
ncbi:MAG: hypothetical protein MJ152_02420, partial [Clostridia bacterium]|nr:hypothetical protein [Clostridia bacterium]